MHRRKFIQLAGLAVACAAQPLKRFKVGAISDGFSEDFEEALKILKSYGLGWVEIRSVFGIYNTEASPAQIRRIKELLDRYQFRVSVVDSALYKCTLPGTKPANGEKEVHAYSEQMDLLKRACDRGHAFGADKIRGFTFWRVAEPGKFSGQIAQELGTAAAVAKSAGMRIVIENEESCNAATGHELAEILKRAPATNLGANWDIGNGYWRGEVSFPDGYNALDKTRIWHMHLKGVSCGPQLSHCSETPAGEGQIDLAGQCKALIHDGYDGTMSLECESKAAGLTHVETSRRSLEGLLRIIKATTESR